MSDQIAGLIVLAPWALLAAAAWIGGSIKERRNR